MMRHNDVGLGSGGNSESETQSTAVPEYVVIGIEKSASELAADLALFTSGTASVLMMCKAKKHVPKFQGFYRYRSELTLVFLRQLGHVLV